MKIKIMVMVGSNGVWQANGWGDRDTPVNEDWCRYVIMKNTGFPDDAQLPYKEFMVEVDIPTPDPVDQEAVTGAVVSQRRADVRGEGE